MSIGFTPIIALSKEITILNLIGISWISSGSGNPQESIKYRCKSIFMENLGIDGKLLIAQLVNFGIFFFLFGKFISKPFLKFLQQERQNEKDKESLLSKLKKGEEKLDLRDKEMRNKIKKERNEIIEKSKEEGLHLREQLLTEAKKDAETLKEKAMKEVEEEKVKLHQDVKNKVADLSVLLVEKTLQQNLDEDSKKRITQSLLKNLPVIK